MKQLSTKIVSGNVIFGIVLALLVGGAGWYALQQQDGELTESRAKELAAGLANAVDEIDQGTHGIRDAMTTLREIISEVAESIQKTDELVRRFRI
jgi:methyl-accepting chemotaxis protein